jgi:hypothetical protein
MAESLDKLRPDRDLQCYFERPSAIAALSATNATGFTVSGTWRQQFDWAVVEWNRDNVFEHPAFRNLPDGDLSGLELTYDEIRTNCVPMDSDLYWAVDWPFLRIWPEGSALPRKVRLRDCATPIEGSYTAATADLELQGTPTAGDTIGIAWLSEQYHYLLTGADTIQTAAEGLAGIINQFSTTVQASATGARITLTCMNTGANWNRIGVYGFVAGARTQYWQPWYAQFAGGTSPFKWRVHLDFGNLLDTDGVPILMTAVRKMRWTYAADLQAGAFLRSEFQIQVSNWTVTGANRAYSVAGPASRRIEDTQVSYTGTWNKGTGNFSDATIHWTAEAGSGLSCTYRASASHALYLGTRKTDNGGEVSISVDGGPPVSKGLQIPGEDVLVRIPLGTFGDGNHSVTISFTGPAGGTFYLDYLEIAVPSGVVPEIGADRTLTLATDWDTDHSICLAPERTAWMISALGFHGRQNHYVGALWFYELVRVGHQYAAGTVQFSGTPAFGYGLNTTITLDSLILTHNHYLGDSAETVAKAFELEINRGYLAYRASSQGGLLTIYARAMGAEGNAIALAASTTDPGFQAQRSGPTLAGGNDGDWRTDLAATPRLNRAARDWSRSFFAALQGYGIDAAAALSTELQHGDPSLEAGIAQRCPSGDPVIVNTPALQTNFSATSIAFWKEAFRDLAQTMEEAGMQPYLQFGELQWWYFRDARSGMPFYDAEAKAAFLTQYGHDMGVITDNTAPPSAYPDEVAFLPTLIANFTNQVMGYVRQSFSNCRFEVLYPLDVNETDLNRAINYPSAGWTPQVLDCLKTESFGYTYGRDLNKCRASILLPRERSFPPSKSAHLIGISDPISPWMKEVSLALAEGVESVVLFALDQFCLIGYPAPLPEGQRRSSFQG